MPRGPSATREFQLAELWSRVRNGLGASLSALGLSMVVWVWSGNIFCRMGSVQKSCVCLVGRGFKNGHAMSNCALKFASTGREGRPRVQLINALAYRRTIGLSQVIRRCYNSTDPNSNSNPNSTAKLHFYHFCTNKQYASRNRKSAYCKWHKILRT